MPYSTYKGKQFYTQLEEYIKENNINQQQIEKSLEKEYRLEKVDVLITRDQGTIWIKSDESNIVIEKLQELNLDGANKISYRSIFDICSDFL